MLSSIGVYAFPRGRQLWQELRTIRLQGNRGMANDLTIYDQGRHFQLLGWPLHYECVRIVHGLFFLLNGFCIKDILNHLDVELITCFLYMHTNDTNEIEKELSFLR